MTASRERTERGRGIGGGPFPAPLPLTRFLWGGLPRVGALTLGVALAYGLLLWIGRDFPIALPFFEPRPDVETVEVETAAPAAPLPVPPAPRAAEDAARPSPPVPSVLPPSVGAAGVAPRPLAAAAAPAPAAPAALPPAGGRASLFNVSPSGARRVVYLIDISGSMFSPLDPVDGPNSRTRLDAAFEEVRRSIGLLAPDTAFDVILFGDRAVALTPAPEAATPEAKQRLDPFLARLPDVGGGTNFMAGIGAAFKMAPDSVFLLTDGGANEPPWQLARKLAALQAAAPAAPRIYAFGMTPVLDDDGDQLLQKICRMSRGSYQPMSAWSRPAEAAAAP